MSIFNKPLSIKPFFYENKNMFNTYDNINKEIDKELIPDEKNFYIKDKRDFLYCQKFH